MRRHEGFRTAFVPTDGEPRQAVLDGPELELPIVDLSTRCDAEPAAALEGLRAELGRAHFDLAQPPLFRPTLVRLSADEHVLFLATHHIVFDDWSMGVLMEEFSALYSALRAGLPPALPEKTIDYADFATWQRRWLDGAVLENETRYWKRQLAGALTTLKLPIARRRSDDRRGAAGQWRDELEENLSIAAGALGRAHGATPYMTLLSAFGVLLGRYTGRRDLLVGTAIAGRNSIELESLIGCFVNTLVMRINLSGAPSALDVLRRVRGTALDAFAHQDMPFERLVDELRPHRRPGESPLVQVAFGVQNAFHPVVDVPGLTVTREDFSGEEARLDLTVWVEERGGRLSVLWTYDRGFFGEADVIAMHRDFEAVVRALVTDCTVAIDTIVLPSRSSDGARAQRGGSPHGSTRSVDDQVPGCTTQAHPGLLSLAGPSRPARSDQDAAARG